MARRVLRPPARLSLSTVDPTPVRVDHDGIIRWYPARWAVRFDHPQLDVVAALAFVTDGGGPRCVEMCLSLRDQAGGLSAGARVPTPAQVRDLVRDAIAAVASPVAGGIMSTAAFPPGWLGENFGPVREQVARPVRRVAVTDDLLREVAALYREAVAAGVAPRPFIAAKVCRSPSTVATWLGMARRRVDPATGEKFLRPPPGRTAGEIADPHHNQGGEI